MSNYHSIYQAAVFPSADHPHPNSLSLFGSLNLWYILNIFSEDAEAKDKCHHNLTHSSSENISMEYESSTGLIIPILPKTEGHLGHI